MALEQTTKTTANGQLARTFFLDFLKAEIQSESEPGIGG